PEHDPGLRHERRGRPSSATDQVAEERGTTMMIETRPAGAEPETVVPAPRFPLLRAALWWVLPAVAMIAGGWTAAMVLVASGEAFDPSTALTCAAAVAVAVFGGMCLFERLLGTPGAALGIGVTIQLIHSPFVEYGVIPGWSASAGWLLTALVTGALTWRAHARRPPLIRTAEPVVATRAGLDELVGTGGRGDQGEQVTVSGRFRLSGWPRTALQAVELPGNPPAEIDAVVSVETSANRGTAFVIRNDGRCADLVTSEHLLGAGGAVRVHIAGTVRAATPLPRPDPDRYPHLGAEDVDLRLLRIDSTGLAVAPLEISSAEGEAIGLSVGYPHGGVPRFVWPANPVPLPVVGVGRLVVSGADAELWTSWRIQAGSSGGPVLVREDGRLRVAAVTYVQHATRRSRGNAAHIPAAVLRAYIAAVG
ncbi:MAG: S1 family peptidase, partial [Pseudonocardia sp.]